MLYLKNECMNWANFLHANKDLIIFDKNACLTLHFRFLNTGGPLQMYFRASQSCTCFHLYNYCTCTYTSFLLFLYVWLIFIQTCSICMSPEVYSEPNQTFLRKYIGEKLLTIFGKIAILDVWQGSGSYMRYILYHSVIHGSSTVVSCSQKLLNVLQCVFQRIKFFPKDLLSYRFSRLSGNVCNSLRRTKLFSPLFKEDM